MRSLKSLLLFLTVSILVPIITTSVYASSIRNIDFNNFTYPGIENLQNSPTKSGPFTLKNGETEDAICGLDKVTYGYLTGDGQEEAMIKITYGPPTGNTVFTCIYVFALQNNTPKLLWGTVDTNILTAIAQNGMLVFEVAKYTPNDPICCPSEFGEKI